MNPKLPHPIANYVGEINIMNPKLPRGIIFIEVDFIPYQKP